MATSERDTTRRPLLGGFCCTPCMIDSLEVQVLFTSRWGEVIAKRKGVIAR
jgi:hypothetical protein